MNSATGFGGDLTTQVSRAPRIHTAKSMRLPFGLGRIMFTGDAGEARRFADEVFATNLSFEQRRNGKLYERGDLGSGLVTNVGSLALANDFAWAQNCQTLKLSNNHASGIGTTTAAATDFKLQSQSGVGGQNPVAGTQSLVTQSGPNAGIYKTVATISYTGSEAVTEWGLFTSNTLSATTGTPFTATTSTTATVTGTPYTASSSSVQGQQQNIVIPGTTAVWGLITSNTTSVLTVATWYTQSASATPGSTPGSTEAFTLRPVMWDHKVFSPINVNTGDSITFTYQLTVNSAT
jgi:hypothetical protein